MVLVPVMIMLVMLGVQMAVWYHAANVAQSAAAQGASAGAVANAVPSAGVARAAAVVAENGASLVGRPGTGGGFDQVTVRVTVAVAHIVPFFPRSVSSSATEARERFVAEDQREA